MNALRTILPALFLSLGCIAAPATLFHDDFSVFQLEKLFFSQYVTV